MSDMISRKAVYDAIECMHFASDAEQQYAFSLLEQIPTAQPEVETQMSLADCISRQDAIDALNEYFARIEKLKRRRLTKGEKAISLDTVGVIKTMSSVQSEIIRCKDCRWKYGAECVRFAEIRPFPDDFCSRAEAKNVENN